MAAISPTRTLVAWHPDWPVVAGAGREAMAWEPVVEALQKLVVSLEVIAPGEVAMGIRGPARYFGGERVFAELVLQTIDSVAGTSTCKVGVADGLFSAGVAARSAGVERIRVVPAGMAAEWLAPVPIWWLGADYEELAGLLSRLGVRTLGDLAALPAPAVLGRFGTWGEAAHRLARGLDSHPLDKRAPPIVLSMSAELDPPELRVEAAAFVAKGLAGELLARLRREGLTAAAVSVRAETEHGERLVRRWRFEGVASETALAARVRWQLEGWLRGGAGAGRSPEKGAPKEEGPTGGLTFLELTPEGVYPDNGTQLSFWGHFAGAARVARALARVQGLLGPEGVKMALLAGGRGYAEQVLLVSWGGWPTGGTVGRRGRPRDRREVSPWPGRIGGPAPAVVFPGGGEGALTADLKDPGGEPVEVGSRGMLSGSPAQISVGGRPYEAVIAWAGPWPLEERWWDRGGRRRARLQVLLEGGEAYLLSRERRRWWVEGFYC